MQLPEYVWYWKLHFIMIKNALLLQKMRPYITYGNHIGKSIHMQLLLAGVEGSDRHYNFRPDLQSGTSGGTVV